MPGKDKNVSIFDDPKSDMMERISQVKLRASKRSLSFLRIRRRILALWSIAFLLIPFIFFGAWLIFDFWEASALSYLGLVGFLLLMQVLSTVLFLRHGYLFLIRQFVVLCCFTYPVTPLSAAIQISFHHNGLTQFLFLSSFAIYSVGFIILFYRFILRNSVPHRRFDAAIMLLLVLSALFMLSGGLINEFL
jgi:hypothetical protein